MRYIRHIKIPEISETGQMMLGKAKVLIIGAGGLGSPAALYLALAGVGSLTIIDSDTVDESNLNRQFLHDDDDIGMEKSKSAAASLHRANPAITVHAFTERITRDTVQRFLKGHDIVIDASDNYETKFLLNDACILAGIPLIHGGVAGFDGQCMVILPKQTGCLRCIFQDISRDVLSVPPGEYGVLGSVAGIIGSMQATEAIKYIIGSEGLLINKLLRYEGIHSRFSYINNQRRNNCRVCSDAADICTYTGCAPEFIDNDETH